MMTVLRFSPSLAFALAALPLFVPNGAAGQAIVQPLPGTTDADRLAEQIRALAANPTDVAALVAAGELSLKLDDLSGAASLFARADKIDPRNGRVKAGMASILVRSERPGEALRYFAMADGDGVDPVYSASDRALAYDLIGEQERAQRAYRLALKQDADDETIRRYALSLGISGKRDQALAELDPLLRKTDRGAWRTRAFILAMNGDQPGAERIATTMMPPGLAAGLQPFFEKLPALGPADRAFAVHFGEIRSTPERIADARAVPALAPLMPEPAPPVVLASTPQAGKSDRHRRDRKKKQAAVQLAAAAPVPVPAHVDLPPPPTYRASAPAVLSAVTATAADRPLTAAEAASLAAARGGDFRRSSRRRVTTVAAVPTQVAASSLPASEVTVRSPRVGAVATSSPPAPASVRATPVGTAAQPASPASATVPAVSAPTPMPVQVAASPPPSAAIAEPATVASNSTVSEPTPIAPAAAPVETASDASMPVSSPATADKASEDTILARIIAGLSIPASELGVAEPVRPAKARPVTASDTAAHVVAEAKAKEARDAAAEHELAVKTATDRHATARQEASRKRVLAAAKLAAEKKLAASKTAADEKKAVRGNPERIWVQVAGGANESDLAKAWAAVKAKAPAALAGRQGWTTPLRATNRVLTGPFRTDAEARDFVNRLGKAGISAFSFTSEAGQVVTRLPTK